jgi:hypothetical protein
MRKARAILLVLVWACGKSQAVGSSPTPAASSGLATAVPAPVQSAASATRTTGAWRGTYKSSPASLYIPPDWKDVHWKVKETSAGIGEGEIAIQVEPTSGRIVGTLGGPLGPASIRGLGADGKLTAAIARKNPSDEGFAGTIVGVISNDRVDGTMYVSLGEANAIRTATFTMAPEGAMTAAH